MDRAEIVRDFAGLAAEPGRPAERAEAVLARLRRVLPFDAGAISVLPDGDGAAALARTGYDERVCSFLDGPLFLEDVERAGLRAPGRPVRLHDLPFPPAELAGWEEYLVPAGFRDGMGAALVGWDGRYLGVLSLSSEDADGMTDTARDLVGLLAPPIAAAADPWSSLATIAGLVEHATAGVVLSPTGAVRVLPGLPDHRLLEPGSPVLGAAAAALAGGGVQTSFLAPLAAEEAGGTHVRVTALAAPGHVRRFAAAVVLVEPAGDLRGLSAQELQVLGLLVTGASNERIGVALGITRRTVEGHLDHVRAKLAGRSRTAAVARALRLGLFVPPALFVRRTARAPQGDRRRPDRGGRAGA